MSESISDTTRTIMLPVMSEAEVHAQTPDWYGRWRARIHDWVSRNADETLAHILTFVPDMLMLVVRLARDPRVPWMLKGQLLLAAAYVISPVDLVPESLLGPIGLAEDAGVLALVLYWFKGLGQVDPRVLHDNWPGKGDVDRVIDDVHKRILDNRDRIYSHDVWQIIERRFARKPRREGGARRWLRRRRDRD